MKRMLVLLGALGLLLLGAPRVLLAQSMEMTSAKLYIQQNEWDKAIHWLQEALKKKPENPEAHFLLGQGYGMKSKFAEMVREFDLAKQYDKKNKYAKDMTLHRQRYFAESFNAGVKAFNDQNFESAANRFGMAALIDPSQPASLQNLAIAYRQVERELDSSQPCEGCTSEYEWDDATTHCRDVVSGNFARYCCCPQAKEKLDAAIVNTYRQLMHLQPDSVIHFLTLADYYKSREKLDESIATLNKAREQHPGDARVLAELAITYDYMGKSEEAFKTYEQALVSKPDDKDMRFNFGRLYLLREDYPNAIEQFKKVLEVDPNDFDAIYNTGVAYLKIGEGSDKKIRDLEETASTRKQKPDNAEIESLRAAAQVNFQEAVPFLEKAAELKPGQSAVWFNLGVGYTRIGESEKAKAAFDKAEALDESK